MTHFKLPFFTKNTKFTQTLIINSLIVWQCSEIVTNIRQYYRILSHQTLVACMSVSSLLQYIVYLQFVFFFFFYSRWRSRQSKTHCAQPANSAEKYILELFCLNPEYLDNDFVDVEVMRGFVPFVISLETTF